MTWLPCLLNFSHTLHNLTFHKFSMDTKYTDVSWCPERKSIAALRLFKGNLSYLAYFSQAIKDRWHLFNLHLLKIFSVVRGIETQTKRKKCGISCIAITKYYQIWLSWGNERSCRFSHSITLLRNHAWGDVDILLNRKLSSPCSLYWKLVLIIEHSAQVLLTLLLQGEQTLLDWTSVCETLRLRSFSTFVL